MALQGASMKIRHWAMAALAACCPNFASAQDAGPHHLSVTGWLASDNVFRGMSQNDENLTPQVAVDYVNDSGFYAGAWTAPVDYNDASGANYELDLYVGYKRSFGDDFIADLQYIRYIYPDSHDVDLEYHELVARLTFFQRALLLVGFSDDTFASGYNGLYTNFSYSWKLPRNFNLITGIGHYRFDHRHFAGADDYMDYCIGLNRVFGKLDATLSFIDTNERGDRLFGRSAGRRLVLLLKYTF
jgi:uncharacterized protein (TIGR02001 family)